MCLSPNPITTKIPQNNIKSMLTTVTMTSNTPTMVTKLCRFKHLYSNSSSSSSNSTTTRANLQQATMLIQLLLATLLLMTRLRPSSPNKTLTMQVVVVAVGAK